MAINRRGSVLVTAFVLSIAFFSFYMQISSSPGTRLPISSHLTLGAQTNSSTSDLTLSVTNDGPDGITLVAILLNGSAIPSNALHAEGAVSTVGSEFRVSAGVGGAIVVARAALDVLSGNTYQVSLVSDSGNSWSVDLVWP